MAENGEDRKLKLAKDWADGTEPLTARQELEKYTPAQLFEALIDRCPVMVIHAVSTDGKSVSTHRAIKGDSFAAYGFAGGLFDQIKTVVLSMNMQASQRAQGGIVLPDGGRLPN